MPRRTAVAQRPVAIPEHPADAALARGRNGRDQVGEEWRPAFDAVVTAFDHSAAGRDDDAREALQSIGLSSPFLDWKLLIRGLLAYYAGDDGRAMDNWSRLDAHRLPARLVAPLRFVLDPTFSALQPPKTHADLRRRADRLHGGLLPRLRELHGSLAGPFQLSKAFQQAKTLVPQLQREMPREVARIAEVFRVAVVAAGQPEDLERYRELFGTPPDDPRFERLEALALEERQQWHDAHVSWQEYERTLAHLPTWPAADIARARALIWSRMGHHALAVDQEFVPFSFDRPQHLKPTAEQCLRRALELAPDLVEAHEQLIELYRDQKKLDRAEVAGRALLDHFPTHVPTLEILAEMASERGDAEAAWDYRNRAATANPLDRRLRVELACAHRQRARSRAASGNLADAQADLAAALALADGRPNLPSLAQAAATAFKADMPAEAEAMIAQAQALAPKPAVAFALLAEAMRLKLPAKVKKRFTDEFAGALTAPAEVRVALGLTLVICDQRAAGRAYIGQKTHEKKIQEYIGQAIAAASAEPDLEMLGVALISAAWAKLVKLAGDRGQRQFRTNPFFPFFSALGHLLIGRSPWKIEPLLDRATHLAEGLPRDERIAALLEDVASLRERAGIGEAGFGAMNQFFDLFNGDDDFD